MFTLDTLTKVRVLDVRVLSSKNRKPDEEPGAQLLCQATLGAGALAMFDGFLPGMMYRKPQAKKQGELDGLETAELTSVGEHVKRLPWVYEQTGCEVTIDLGLGGRSNITLSDVKVHRVSMRPEQKGVVIQWTSDAPSLDDKTRGRLTGLKSTDVQMLMSGPNADDGQERIDEAPKRPPIDGTVGHPGAARAAEMEAGDAFSAAQGGQPGPEEEQGQGEDDGSGHTDVDGAPGAGSSDDQLGQNWPFPRDGAEGAAGETEAGPAGTEAHPGETPAQETGTAPRARRGRKAAAQVE